jgi:SSS family transporter
MLLATSDWIIISLFFMLVLAIGWITSKTAGKNTAEFFLGGRSMPWWLLGVSMVATTFSADTPNLVTGFVREGGVARNWAWWAFLITGMVTVFIYAKLWRRSNITTDLEFYEIRYGGKAATFLRGFRALYLGVFFNCLIMGTVTLAAIKIAAVMFGLTPIQTVLISGTVVMAYSAMGGIKGVIWTDFFQFGIAMTGAVYAAFVAVRQPEIGSLKGLITHPELQDKLAFVPELSDPSVLISLFIIPIAVQWWSVWYPGSEPGGGGYIAQRMLAAKNEKHAIGATMFFNFAHYALRPWPWIIVALASIVLFPDLASIKEQFPSITDQYLGHDIAYPVMMTLLGPGWLGLVVASLIAAFMSTISTHLNWGSSYIVNDFYKRFVRPDAEEKELVRVGRLSTVVLMVLAGLLALTLLEDATQAFDILLLSGAGTGGLFLLRWFWWRINAVTEIVAMVVATVLAFILVLVVPDEALATRYVNGFAMKLLIATGVTTFTWLVAVFLTRPESWKTLFSFYKLTRPGGPGWKAVLNESRVRGMDVSSGRAWDMPKSLLAVLLGCIAIYSALFSTGNFIYGNTGLGFAILGVFLLATAGIYKLWPKLDIGN